MNPKEEQDAVKQARENIRHFEKLYEAYFEDIYGYIYRKTTNQTIAQNLTQQTFFTAIEKFNTYHDRGNSFGSWLYRIAHNMVMNEYKKRMPAVLENTEEMVNEKDLERCMSELPPSYKDVIDLKKEGLKNKEIADILEKSEESIKTTFFRALQMFKDCFAEIYT